MGMDTFSITVDPTGQFAYVTGHQFGPAGISAFTIDATTGSLTPVPGSPFPTGALTGAPVVDPTGRFLYVTSALGDQLWAYAIDATGALTPVPGSPFPLSGDAGGVTVDPTGRFVYAGQRDQGQARNGDIAAYTIDATTGVDGRIYAIGGDEYASDAGTAETYDPSTGAWIMVAPLPTPRNRLAAVAGPDGKIYALGGTTIDDSGVLCSRFTTAPWKRMTPSPTPGRSAPPCPLLLGGYRDWRGWRQRPE